jgi:hypothetical protein
LGEVQARRRFRQRLVVDDCGEGFEVIEHDAQLSC